MGDQKPAVTTSKELGSGKAAIEPLKPAATDIAVTLPPSLAAGSTKPVVKPVDAKPTKMELATEIYKRMKGVKDVTRKDIIEKFVADVKLSKAGASTYYQMIKAKQEVPMKK